MAVEFFKDSADEHRWRIREGDEPDGDIIHSCHEGFTRKSGSVQNLFLNHAMMSVFVRRIAGETGTDPNDGEDYIERTTFELGNDGKVRWKITAANGETIGISHKGFPSKGAAINNLIVTYTMLTMFIAVHAQDKIS